jgi:hypothetical protein
MQEKTKLRRQDFWTALLLIAVSIAFIAKTAEIPFIRTGTGGVAAGHWYNSPALVPYGIFGTLLILSLGLLIISIRDGGWPNGLSLRALRTRLVTQDATRIAAVSLIMLAYIFALVPRVDFTLCSALVMLALIYGFHEKRARATLIATIAVLIPSVYALAVNFPQARWNAPHDDDWLTLAVFLALIPVMWIDCARAGRVDGFIKAAPVIAFVVPLLLIIAMAFGFRQNVPNRTGLMFSQIEYHFYVNWRPFVRGLL